MAEVPWFKISTRTLRMILIMSPEDIGYVFLALTEYYFTGQIPDDLTKTSQMLFIELAESLNHCIREYQLRCERN